MRSSYLIWCCRKERSWEPPELVPLRVSSPVDEKGEGKAKEDDDNPIDPKREAALNFLATRISPTVNPEPNPVTPPRRLPSSRRTYSEFNYTYENFDALIADAENYSDGQGSSPPDGPSD